MANPYRERLSPRICSDVKRRTRSPTAPMPSMQEPGTFTRKVTPPTATSAQSAPTPSRLPLMDVISDETTAFGSLYGLSRRASRPCEALMWQMATARASAASEGWGGSCRSSSTFTISWTCSLELPP